ncbi:MAG TPA: hypothetical protein VGG75_10440 [Trebonia sp.]|jgi:hypothetical protein
MSCDEFADVAAELALGVLTGRERADAVAHLETCDSCRETVRQLSMTGEDLAGLLPAAEPPAGFEARVLSRIGIPAPVPEPVPSPRPEPGRAPGPGGRLRRSRKFLAVAAVVAVLAGGAGGWGLRAATAPRGTAPAASVASALTSAPLLSAARQRVGTVFYYQGNPRWMYMVVDLSSGQHGSASGTVTCQLAGADGRYTTAGSFRLTSGYGGWGGPDPGIEGRVTGARLVAASGKVLATARFS